MQTWNRMKARISSSELHCISVWELSIMLILAGCLGAAFITIMFMAAS